MKILIGTPIHICKDYCMEEWIENVSKNTYPANLLVVDNSPNSDYVEKVKEYCKKYDVKNYKIKYLNLLPNQEYHERIARSREVIRQEIISGGYDAWFSWECDQIIPNNALDKLTKMMKAGDFMMVNHNNWVRGLPTIVNTDLGVSLVKKECLEKYSFLLQFGTDPDMPHNWRFGEPWLKMQVLRDGGSFIEVQGVINPVYHLDDNRVETLLTEEAHWNQTE